MIVPIETYDALERDALTRVGFAEYAAFGTHTFAESSFPVRMSHERELVRYADFFVGMTHDRLEPGRFFRATPIQTDYSIDEVVLLKKISNTVAGITERAAGRRIPVYYNHLGAVGMFRVVQALAQYYGRQTLSIFEPGPGCGYTGALLGLAGHRYAAYDVTQGYYLWQNRLFDALFSSDFVDFALGGDRDCLAGFEERITHLPWWDYMRFHEHCPCEADVIVSNANLGEMHTLGLKYMLRIARRMLEKSEIGLIVFGGIGHPQFGSAEDIATEFSRAGFECVLAEQVYAFRMVGKSHPKDMLEALERGVPIYDPSGSGKTFAPKDFINVNPDEMSDEHRFYAFLDDWPRS